MFAVLYLFAMILNIFSLILLVRVFMSWIPNLDYSNPLIRLVYDITEPVLRPVRQAFPPTSGMDFSPLIVMLVIFFLRRMLGF